MTLVYDRRDDLTNEPQMHAFVVGCGRFPHIAKTEKADRLAAYDSAIAMIDFLLSQEDTMEPRLATVDCLLADPRINPESAQDEFPARPTYGINQPIPVKRPTEAGFKHAINEFILRCRPGDSVYIYFCSHGVAGRDETGLLVLEDIKSLPGNQWQQLVDVKTLAQNLPVFINAKNAWIFMDACQEVLDELYDLSGGVNTLIPVTVTAPQVAKHTGPITALCSGRYGQQTFAPENGGIGYFTLALLDGLTKSCVDRNNLRWKVSSAQLSSSLETVATAAGYPKIAVTNLLTPGRTAFLVDVADPSIPVLVTSRPASTLMSADKACARSNDSSQEFQKNGNGAWRFRAPAEPMRYTINIEKDGSQSRFAMEVTPSAVVWEIC